MVHLPSLPLFLLLFLFSVLVLPLAVLRQQGMSILLSYVLVGTTTARNVFVAVLAEGARTATNTFLAA